MKKTIITIGRQFGSGGRELGKKLAEELGYEYCDKELLALTAKESGLSPEFLERYDEKTTGSFLYSLVMGQPNMFFNTTENTSVEELAAKAQREAVVKVAEKGNCVIVGRCADYILRDYAGIFRVFISADLDDRVARIMKRDHVTETEAQKRITRMDKTRSSYYEFKTDHTWGAAQNYDLCLNISTIGLEEAVKTIAALAGK